MIIGVVMAVVELGKPLLKGWLGNQSATRAVPLVVLGLAGGLQVANAAVFAAGTDLIQALGEGITLGAVAGGVYSLGKAALGKS